MITNIVAALLLAGSPAPVDPAVAAKALALVQRALETEQRWTKVHAAEALLAIGRRGDVARAFERELAQHGGEPEYRIGIWRVLAQAADGRSARDRWIRQIAGAFLDTAGPDRLHASETLGKLAYRAGEEEIAAFEEAARGANGPLAANALWVLTASGRAGAEARLAALLAPTDASGAAIDAGTRATAAYAMRFLPALSPAASDTLAAAAVDDRSGGIVAASLLSAAFVHASGNRRPPLAAALERQVDTGDADVKTEVCSALAMAGGDAAVPLLTTLLSDRSIDVRLAAARALLQIDRRTLTAR